MSPQATLIGLAMMFFVMGIIGLCIYAINKWEDSHPTIHH
jgi:hypothetical protein